MLRNYFITAFRNLIRNKVYSLINILGLSLGLACAMLIILYIKDEVSYDRFHANGDHIYRIFQQATRPDGQVMRMGITGAIQGPIFTSKLPEIKAFVRVQGGYADIKTGSEVNPQPLLRADSNFFSVFSFPLLHGNPKTVLLKPNTIVLSEDAAKKYFPQDVAHGSSAALGKTMLLRMDDRFTPYTVTGITKRCPQNSSIQFDVLLPLKVPPGSEQGEQSWGTFFLNTYLLLDQRADIKTVEAKMTKVFMDDAPEMVKIMEKESHGKLNGSYMLQSFTDIHLNNNMDRYDISGASNLIYSYILSGITFFILLIACINFVNLTVARSLKRAKEIGVRKVIGGSRKQLIIQFLGESFLLCLLAFLLAIVMVQLLLTVFNQLSNKALVLSYLLDAKLVAVYISLFIITSLLAGFYPALVLSNYNPVQTLYNRFSLGGKNYLQKSLVVFQFTLATFLISTTFIISSQFNFLINKKLGYDDSDLVLINKANLTRDESKLFKEELMKSPDILGMAAKDEGYAFNPAKINGNSEIAAAYMTIDESFLPLMKIPVIMGRNFSKSFPSDSSTAVLVNKKFVEDAGWKNPIGQQLIINENMKYHVIGVVKDYHFESLNEKIKPEIFTMRMQNEYGMAYIKIKPNSETASLHHIEKVFKKLFPLNPFSFVFKNQENLKTYETEAKWKQIMLFGSLLTIFISCIGLFGLSVLSAEKRTKEIGIRKVLGASVKDVATILSADFFKLILISLLVAMPLSWLVASKWLENYPYRITLSLWMFTISGLLVVLIAMVTVSFQAIKAGIANPVKSLRTE